MKGRISESLCVLISIVLSVSMLLSLVGCKKDNGGEGGAAVIKKTPIELLENETALYVSPNGNDENDGSFEKPYLTFAAAQKKLREMNDNMKGNIYVVLREGVYTEKIELYQTDSGENGFKTVIKAFPGEDVVISGGKTVSGFTAVEGTKLYKTTLEDVKSVRQFYVNDKSQPRSTSTTRILPSDWLNGSEAKDGFLVKTEYLQGIRHTGGLELRLSYQWQDVLVPVKGVRKCSDTMSCIYMDDFAKKLYVNMATSATELSSGLTLEFFLENSVDLIDEPGEWAFDDTSGELWYYPAEGVDMATALCEIPVSEQLLKVEGLDGSLKAHDIEIEGLRFEKAAWKTPTEIGFVSWQGDAYWENVTVYPNVTYAQMAGNVALKNCEKVTLKNNTFRHLGGAALTAYEGVSNSEISGNAFTECAGGAITIGNYKQATALHTDTKNQLCSDISVSNNAIYRMGQHYYSTVGIQVYHGRNINITHNELSFIANSGISVGWGWNPELITTTENIRVTHNIITNHGMTSRDSGAVYTLGKQKNCVLEDNYIRDTGFSEKGIYHDQGTGGYTNSRNVLDVQKSTYWTNDYHYNSLAVTYNDNYTSTERYVNRVNSVHNNTTYVPDRNWPAAAKKIIFAAGNEAAYGSARAKAYGINSDKLSLWLSADRGILFDDNGSITKVKDFSGAGLEATASGNVAWNSYASYENHALAFSDSSSLRVKDFVKSDAFTVAFVAEFEKDETIRGALETVGIRFDKEADKAEGYTFGTVAAYTYTTDGKSGKLFQNGVQIAEWKKNAPYLSDDFVIGNNSARIFEAVCYKESLSEKVIASIKEYFKDKYSLNIPTSESLVLWLDAAKLVTADKDGLVSAWGDLSSNRLGGLIQANGDYMPKLLEKGINGKPAILFDGKDDSLWNFSTRWISEEASVFVVMELESKASQGFGSVSGAKKFLVEIGADGAVSAGANLPDRVTTEKGAFSFGKVELLTYQRYPVMQGVTPKDELWRIQQNGVIKLFVGDKKLGEYNHSTNNSETQWGGFSLGTNGDTTLSGKVAEVIIYDRCLTESERTAVTEYLRQKYNF